MFTLKTGLRMPGELKTSDAMC